MEEKLEIKYADNGIIMRYFGTDLLYVFQTESEEEKLAAIKELGSLIWYHAVEPENDELNDEVSRYCQANNCICDGVRVTIKIEPTYQSKED